MVHQSAFVMMSEEEEVSKYMPDEASFNQHLEVRDVKSSQLKTEVVEKKIITEQAAPTTTSTTVEATTEDNSLKTYKDKFDKKKNAEILAGKYTKSKRAFETVCITVYITFFSIALYRSVAMFSLSNLWVVMCSFVLSMFVADFFSGIMHWGADTYGSLETPVFGQSIIRSFREHHVVPTAICHHDFIEANGDNCAITLPFTILAAFNSFDQDNLYALFVHNFLLFTTFWAALTNQIHKWSHTYKLPWYVSILQDYGIIISKRDHAVHHRNPFDKYYCITNGWLNPVLANIQFWKSLENVITYATGVVPREDDHLWTGISAKLE
eukprot:TRINITY_DN5335_c0_g1_i1.p1 TRINITY_DN5335_c0_g1~~TRINITY_DN5335_c0_g1_i1.p1  ORF type:complete len:324 (+),score=60.69 TRINITY_DN5335_c0_g1_i1:188-1159(+)